MYRKIVSATYVINIIFQAFLTLLMPSGLCFLASWLLVRYAGAPEWLYAPLLIVGVLLGLISMIKFVISAMSALEKLEAESLADANEKKSLDARRDKLEEEIKALSSELDPKRRSPATSESPEEKNKAGDENE